jgi:hypothetical protein
VPPAPPVPATCARSTLAAPARAVSKPSTGFQPEPGANPLESRPWVYGYSFVQKGTVLRPVEAIPTVRFGRAVERAR